MDDAWEQAQLALRAGERLLEVVEHGDMDDLRQVFAKGAMVWHNTDERLVDVEQSIRNLRAIKAIATDFRYIDVKREPTPTGFVQQHTLVIKTADGREIRDLACCVCRVEDGRIVHMDAYHDSANAPSLPGREGRDWRHED